MEINFRRSETSNATLVDSIKTFCGSDKDIEEIATFTPILETGLQFKGGQINKHAKYWKEAFKLFVAEQSMIRDALHFRYSEHVLDDISNLAEKFEAAATVDAHEFLHSDVGGYYDPVAFLRMIDSLKQFYENELSIESFVERISAEFGSVYFDLRGWANNFVEPFGLTESFFHESLLPHPEMGDEVCVLNEGFLFHDPIDSFFKSIDQIHPMGPLRKEIYHENILYESRPSDLGPRGEGMLQLLYNNSDLIEKVNEWLNHLEIDYNLYMQPISTGNSARFNLLLRDMRRSDSLTINIRNVGFGIGQILPIIVKCLIGKNQLITIQQPETHIHPRLQASLADLLADTIFSSRGHSFLIETHSEHLMLRLQRLVAESKLKPNDVAVLYVSRGDDGSEVRRLRLDDEGRFLDEWPGGFFPERRRELLRG